MSIFECSQVDVISRVYNLVMDILKFDIDPEYVEGVLNDIYSCFMKHYSDNTELIYIYPLKVFFGSAQAIVGDQYPEEVVWSNKEVEIFIRLILEYEEDIDYDVKCWVCKQRQNREVLRRYIGDLTSHYARLLFVRVDLKYTQDSFVSKTVEHLHEDMKRLCQLIKNKKGCFRHLQGYAWTLEQGGTNGGLHCHLLLIYDGARRQNDWAIAKEVGEKWKNITYDSGTYYNCHDTDNKKLYEKNDLLGIGMIHRDNEKEVKNACRTALYLTDIRKNNQRLKAEVLGMLSYAEETVQLNLVN